MRWSICHSVICVASVVAHGSIWKLQYGDDPPLLIGSPYSPNKTAARYGRPIKSTSPIFDLASPDSACNAGQGGKVVSQPYAVAAGQNVTFWWDHNVRRTLSRARPHLTATDRLRRPVDDERTSRRDRAGLTREQHRGPVLTYMASCGSDCSNVVAAGPIWFKIDEAGVDVKNIWASIWLSKTGSRWTVALPRALKSGRYLIRHEIVSLCVSRYVKSI